MTKRGWRPAWRMTLDGKREQVHPPTEDELSRLDLKLDAWHNAHPDAMPPELWEELRDVIDRLFLQYTWSREEIQHMRWLAVHMGLSGVPLLRRSRTVPSGKPLKSGNLKRALRYAEDSLRGSPAEAQDVRLKQVYYEIERRRRGVISPRKLPHKPVAAKRPRR